jgi:RNA-directed DNA polymerase
MKDRAMQGLYKLALEPVAETLADRNSYGFRLRRSAADALGQCFIVFSSEIQDHGHQDGLQLSRGHHP